MRYVLHYIRQLYSYTGKILYFNLLAMGFISVLEGVGIFLLIPLISISGIIGVNTGATPISKYLHFLQGLPETLGLPFILCFYVLLVIGQHLMQRNLTIRNVTIVQGFVHHLRIKIYRGILQSNWDFFIKRRKSDLIHLFTTEIGRVSAGITLFLQFVTSLIFTVIQVCFAFWLSAKMTIFVLTFGVVLAFFSRKFISKSKKLGNKTSLLTEEYLAGMTDQLNGIKDIKSNTLEESRLTWLRSLTEKMLEERVEYIQLKTSSQLFYKTASAIFIALFIFISVKMFHTQPEQFLLIIVIFSRLWPRITGIQSSMEQIASTIPVFKAFIDLQIECEAAKELKGEDARFVNVSPIELKQGLECRQVDFRYNRNETNYALRDISLNIPSNRMTAIVGRSGAGKSTLIDILMGLNQAESGQVFIDGTPLTSENLLSLRRSISYVPQDPFLFNGSIRENLLMIEPHASEEELWEALEFAACSEFVARLPQRLDTRIGDRGVRLSGGERQRLVLARAILRNPSILVLDEATSALDAENEAKIQEAIERLKGRMTIIVIAHRLSTIRNADQVVVLDQGQIVQMGGFHQLAKEKKGLFNNLLQKQMEVNVI